MVASFSLWLLPFLCGEHPDCIKVIQGVSKVDLLRVDSVVGGTCYCSSLKKIVEIYITKGKKRRVERKTARQDARGPSSFCLNVHAFSAMRAWSAS
jgi:hypothetical protein